MAKNIHNIKIARSLLNMSELRREMSRYNFQALQKYASVGAYKDQRIKYAALHRQYVIERQNFIDGVVAKTMSSSA